MAAHHRSLVLLSTLLVGAALATEAEAYVPPGTYIIGKMAEKRGALAINDLDILLQSQYPEQAANDNEERLYLKRGGKLRWQRNDGNNESLVVLKDGVVHEVAASGEVMSEKQPFEPLVDLLVPRAQATEATHSEYLMICQKLGIETSAVHLGRFASRVAYVIGSKPSDKDKPELWIDKDSLAPVRVVYHSTAAGKEGLYDVQFREYGSREGGELVPRVIDRYLNGKLLSHSEVERATANTKLADALFTAPVGKR